MTSTERMARAYVGFASRHALLILIGFSALTAVSVWAVTTLRVDTNFRSLLPDDTPSVLALEQSEQRRGSVELYTIAVESPDPQANARFIDDLKERLAEWPEAQWVQADDDPSFFQDNVLLYMPVERLESFRESLDDALDCRLADINPMFVNLEDCDAQDEVEWTFDYWIGENLASDIGVPEDFFGDLEAVLSGDDGATGDGAEPPDDGTESSDEEAAPPAVGNGQRDIDAYITNEDGTIVLVYVQLDQPSTDMAFANEMTDRGAALIAELGPTSYHPEMRAEVVGAYENLKDAQDAVGDSVTALYASLAMVLVIMLLFFRAIRGILIVVVPLLMGVAWTMGLTRLTYAELNIYTLFVGSVLVGMGIDFGIHLYGRALEEFRRGLDWPEALTEALNHTGRAVLASAITTIGALLTLLFSHFQGFKEFGVVASYGIVLCVFSAWLVIPPMVFLFERLRALPRRAARRRNRRVASGATLWVIVPAIIVLAAAGVSATMLGDAEFEYDFRNFRSTKKTEERGISYGSAVGRGRASAPALILGENEPQMRQVHQVLRDRLAEGRPYMKGFITIETFVPPDQEERLRIINRIGRLVNRRIMNRLTGETADFVTALRERVAVEPFGIDAVPQWAVHSIEEADGSVGALGLFFRNVQNWNVLEVRAYQADYQRIEVPSGTVELADSTFINADIIDTVQSDAERIGLIVAGMLALILLVALRNVIGSLICLVTLAAALLLAVGTMVVTHTKLGMFNMIVLPAVLGVSIDGAIHLYHRYREEGSRQLRRVMTTTGVAVAAASLTTAGGFGGLLLQHHQGIASIGELAVIGIISALVGVFALMPALLVLFARPKAES